MSVKAQQVLNYDENIENKKFHWNCTVCKIMLSAESLTVFIPLNAPVWCRGLALVLYHRQVRLWNVFINAVCGQFVELNAIIKFLNEAVLKGLKYHALNLSCFNHNCTVQDIEEGQWNMPTKSSFLGQSPRW